MASKPSILIDLNVLLDVLHKHEPFYKASAELLADVETGRVEGFIAAHSLTTLFYLIQKGNFPCGCASYNHQPVAVYKNSTCRSKYD